MDTTQFLLSTAVTITTVLLIIVSIQLISLLKQLKKDHIEGKEHIIKSSDVKKSKVIRKKINLISLLEKMKFYITHIDSPKKKFFKSTKLT